MERHSRRSFARTAAGLGVFGCLSGCVAPRRYSGAPMFRYDPSRTGHAPAECGPKTQPTLAWRAPVATAQSTPAVVDGRVFIGRNDGYLYAVE